MNIATVEKAIGRLAEGWEGKCYEIACAMLRADVVKGTARYGHWTGPVEKGSRFHGRSVVPHGWIETPNKAIIDPTRWVFEVASPYIYEGKNDFYDTAANGFRRQNARPCPLFDEKAGPVILLPERGKTRAALNALLPKGASDGNKITLQQIHWIATQPPDENAKLIYEWLIKKKHGAFIPVDNRELILGGAPTNL